ncbi:methyltransferase family protein, partial [Bacillus sp. SIMBA_005]
LAFAAGALLQTGLDLPLPTGDARTAMHLTGTVFANAGGLLALACFALFVWRRTTILPSQTPSRLIVRGPYRLSRNPFYLSLLL